MSRLIGFSSNESERIACALHGVREQLIVARPAEPPVVDSWGIGFFQEEVLLRKQPRSSADPIDFYSMVSPLRTDTFIAHARTRTLAEPSDANTPPYRFRSWLFAHHGELLRFAEVQSEVRKVIPEFLLRNLRGETDSEHFFHLILTALHERGLLEDAEIPVRDLRQAIETALAIYGDIAGHTAMLKSEVTVVLGNSKVLLAARQGPPAYLLTQNGIFDCPVCREKEPAQTRRRIDHEHLRTVMFIAAASTPPPPPFAEVADRSFVTVNADFRIELQPFATTLRP